jgi:cell division protein FtsI/penicillin-binding protein 2
MFGSAAVVRLGYWQVVAAPALAAEAISSLTPPKEARVGRAQIVDRDGTILAQTASFDRLDAHPKDIDPEERADIVATLADILDLSVAEQESFLAKLSSEASWDWLKRRVTHQQSADIRVARDNGDLPGISLAPQAVRAYPRKGGQNGTTVASHLLGVVAGDGRGAYGVEQLYEDRLTGDDTSSVPVASLVGAPAGLDDYEAPALELTIDFKLQKQLERALNNALVANQAKSVSGIIVEPHTGAILALASVPGYNANEYAKVAEQQMSLLRNPVVSDQFEPGSVMKIFTAAAALQSGAVTPQTKIKDEPRIKFYKYTVSNADKKGKGWMSVKKVIGYSRNVATAKIAQLLAPRSTQRAARILYDFWAKVGLVGKTGVDIASEAEGTYWDPEDALWAPVDLANRAFGQSVAVTLLQLATGYSTLVNGGYLVQPHVVQGGTADQVEPQRVVSTKVARQSREILEYVTGGVPWYARGTLIPGYKIGGKTGTAQIWDSDRGRWKNKFNHNFVGFVGSDRPDVVIAVRIEEAKFRLVRGVPDLKIESYELFQSVARGAIKHLGIKKSKDPSAGLPIIGSQAARELTPNRGAIAKPGAKQGNKRDRERDSRKSRAGPRKGDGAEKARGAKRDKARNKVADTADGRGARRSDDPIP